MEKVVKTINNMRKHRGLGPVKEVNKADDDRDICIKVFMGDNIKQGDVRAKLKEMGREYVNHPYISEVHFGICDNEICVTLMGEADFYVEVRV